MTKARDLADLLDSNGQIDNADIVDNTISNSKFAQPINFKNIIINGDMSIAQRGTSATGLGNGDSGYHTCDRWKLFESGAPTYEFTQTQDTDVPTGQGFATSLKMDCTTADASLASTDLLRIMQIFEGQNLQYLKYGTSNAQSLTASFWVKSNVTGDYNTHLYAGGATNRIITNTFTINSANTWEKKTITFAGDTAQVISNDNQGRLLFTITLLSGTDYTSTDGTSWGTYSGGKLAYGQVANIASSTANNFYITGVQLEAGTTASDFEFLPYDVNLQRCQRYFQIAGGGLWGTITNGSGAFTHRYFNQPLIVKMRDVPSISFLQKNIDFWTWGGTVGLTTTIGRSFDATGLGFIGTQNDKNYVSGRVSTASIDDITRGELLMDITDNGTFNVDAEL